jgi:hypothetical protein
MGSPRLYATGSACSVRAAGLGEPLIAGNSPEALPAPETEPLRPSGSVPETAPGRADPPEPVAAVVGETAREEAEAVGEGSAEADEGAEGVGELVAAGVATAMLAEALGGVHSTSVGTTAVAVSVSVEPAGPGGTRACIWSVVGEPRTPMVAIQQCDVLAPMMQLDVKTGVPEEDAPRETVTSSATPPVTETWTR